MAVLLNRSSKVLAYAATGAYGRNQLAAMRSAGTDLVSVVALGRGGEMFDGLPVFNTVADAVSATAADTAIVYAPALGVRSAVIECADSGIRLAVTAAEYVPVHDALYAAAYARERGLYVVGPNTAGMATPGEAMLGAITPGFTMPGNVGIIGRSGTLTLTVARTLSSSGIGQSTIVHIGGDSIAGRNPHEWLQLFLEDSATRSVVYLGELGGRKEYALAEAVASSKKPVVAMVVGRHAPSEKRMGHAGALAGNAKETADAKLGALAEAGAVVCRSPMDISEYLSGIQNQSAKALAI